MGFIWAGWTPIIGNDIDKYAVETHKRNLGGEAIVGDINSQEVHDAIVDAAVAAKKANPTLPQRRDRVIIIGGDADLVQGFSMKEISCVPKDGQLSLLPSVIGVEDAIGDLPPLQPGEDGSQYNYRFPAANLYQKFMRGEITADEYLDSYL